jgi:hypothetical protein
VRRGTIPISFRYCPTESLMTHVPTAVVGGRFRPGG